MNGSIIMALAPDEPQTLREGSGRSHSDQSMKEEEEEEDCKFPSCQIGAMSRRHGKHRANICTVCMIILN